MLLVELLIAMALTMGILTLLLSVYDQIDRANIAIEKEQVRSFDRLYLSTRLSSILPKAIPYSPSEKANDYLFFTSSIGANAIGTSSLLFSFDNGVKLDPLFSNHVIGCLYVNNHKQLCLATWPSQVHWDNLFAPPQMKNEILYNNVERLTFEFYIPPVKNREAILGKIKNNAPQISEPLKQDLDGGWKNEWQQEYKALPAMVRLRLMIATPQGESVPLMLVYPLPMSPLIIVYDR
jgi:hypothetical protein